MTGYIYKFTNHSNGKIYIGKTTNIHERLVHHKCITPKLKTKFGYALKKYGIDHFEFEVIITIRNITNPDRLTIILNNLEKHFISKYDSYHSGYNSTLGGDGTLAFKVSEDTKRRISESHKRNMTPERYAKLSEQVREAGKNTRLTEAQKAKAHIVRQKKVIQLSMDGEFIAEFSSVKEAALATGSRRSDTNIINVCKGKVNSANGFKWRYQSPNV